ncbi:MAG: threonine synthase, partial [Alphaproteobacteria bacterium]|nr:threonine synthase [Alphaproteobacteria bacterium]
APALDFADAMLTGLARDGGLYVPESWPRFSADEIAALAGLDYAEVAYRVTRPFIGAALDAGTYRAMVEQTYRVFTHGAVAPLVELAPNHWLMELFHGPTLAFKDYAMQLLGNLFNHILGARGRRVTIIGATSGDTGSAAIEACRGREAIDIFILFPNGRVSDVQRRQMTTVDDSNVHAIAIDGTFDDCQALLKDMFNDPNFRDEVAMSGVNSINWARILGQIVYYFVAAAALGCWERKIAFAVPTGNFGNIYAGYAAREMGLPISHLVLATNANDILSNLLATGTMTQGPVHASLSPSMDIQVASNFERYLFDLLDRDGAAVAQAMTAFQDGELALSQDALGAARDVFAGFRMDDAGTLEEIGRRYEASGQLLDPHSAIGVAAGAAKRGDGTVPMVSLATAHPAKFPDAVEQATGIRPPLPAHMADLMERTERFDVLANDLAAVQGFVRDRLAEKEVA